MMSESARSGKVFGSEGKIEPNREGEICTRFDLANLKIQRYVDTAIASYTLLVSTGGFSCVQVAAHNESRVMVKIDEEWKVVHVHKSPAWPASHLQAPHIPA